MVVVCTSNLVPRARKLVSSTARLLFIDTPSLEAPECYGLPPLYPIILAAEPLPASSLLAPPPGRTPPLHHPLLSVGMKLDWIQIDISELAFYPIYFLGSQNRMQIMSDMSDINIYHIYMR
jgi:hypothetical protein